jgi:hypothetical protein
VTLDAEARSESLCSRATLRGGDPDPLFTLAVGFSAVNAFDVLGRDRIVDISMVKRGNVPDKESFQAVFQREVAVGRGVYPKNAHLLIAPKPAYLLSIMSGICQNFCIPFERREQPDRHMDNKHLGSLQCLDHPCAL